MCGFPPQGVPRPPSAEEIAKEVWRYPVRKLTEPPYSYSDWYVYRDAAANWRLPFSDLTPDDAEVLLVSMTGATGAYLSEDVHGQQLVQIGGYKATYSGTSFNQPLNLGRNRYFVSKQYFTSLAFIIRSPTSEDKALLERGASIVTGNDLHVRRDGLGGVKYESADGTEVEIVKVDLGSVYTAKAMGIMLGGYISPVPVGSFIRLYYSTDDVTYTLWFDTGDLPGSFTQYYPPLLTNVDVRYVKVTVNSVSTGNTAYAYIGKLFVWV